MSKKIIFRNVSIGELINTLEKLPANYEVVIYNTQVEQRQRSVILEVSEEEEIVEIY